MNLNDCRIQNVVDSVILFLPCEQALRRALAAGRACNYVSGICIPPPIPLWLPID